MTRSQQIVAALAYVFDQASDTATAFQGWLSQKADELGGRQVPTVVTPSVIATIDSSNANHDQQEARCPLQYLDDLPSPNTTGSAGMSSYRALLEEVLAAIPPVYTGQFDYQLANSENKNSNKETHAVSVPFRVRF